MHSISAITDYDSIAGLICLHFNALFELYRSDRRCCCQCRNAIVKQFMTPDVAVCFKFEKKKKTILIVVVAVVNPF